MAPPPSGRGVHRELALPGPAPSEGTSPLSRGVHRELALPGPAPSGGTSPLRRMGGWGGVSLHGALPRFLVPRARLVDLSSFELLRHVRLVRHAAFEVVR